MMARDVIRYLHRRRIAFIHTYDDPTNTIQVKLDSGETMALKPANVVAQNTGGGSSSAGGMPGMPGGMPDFSSMFGGAGGPGGMPQMPPGMPELPTGTSLYLILGPAILAKVLLGLKTLILIVMLILFLFLLIGVSMMVMLMIGGVDYCLWIITKDAYNAAGGGVAGVQAGFRSIVSTIRSNIESSTGRPVSDWHAKAILMLVVMSLIYMLVPKSALPDTGIPGFTGGKYR